MLYEEEHPFAIAYRLVEEGHLDPWNVDIAQLAHMYIEEIKKMELLDLRVPARAIYAAVFLLKKQVDVLFPEPKRKRERKYTLEEIVQMFEEEEKSNLQNIEPQGYIIDQIKKIRKEVKGYKKSIKQNNKRKTIPIHVSKFEKALEELVKLISQGVKSFSFLDFVGNRNPVPYLLGLMVLYQDGKVDVYQREPYSDIQVEVLE
ncbi:segregation/condensation protein A [Thermocrinis sp.]